MIESVVVLAAGENRRMGAVTGPKALLPLRPDDPAGPTFLSRNLELFRAIGTERVFLVVGSANRAAFEALADDLVELVVIDSGQGTTGSSVSMLAGLQSLLRWRPHGARTLVTDADVVYERLLMDHVRALDGSQLLTIDRVNGDGEEVRVYGRSADEPVLIGKGLDSGMTRDLELLGESLGLILLDAAGTVSAADVTRWIVGEPPAVRPYGFGGRLSEHEEVWQYLFTLGRLPAAQLPGSLLFSECDFPADYQHVQDVLFPAILERDAMAFTR
ncbi:Sden_1164 family protein [Streptomyces castrisilvae]|uniref:Sden_1164 family protein n=1 Tax=Streptomyces castrisilvae TaxID=3033811 RepID=A0ABY9HE80_9ACTN|nr:Sden_1164 family protein [Streptomyces sp. Mut1]WLQ32826.1 Sden_1164 family protein [Streptomyces sp. Mut1]